ncbi:MAG: hypothetical protein PHS41_03930 [Victivallaceae bacterium]|nr:hypothetical protein [Victivallaceae bacterium]
MTVHIILNSHLDPVWLWKLEAGIDEVLATARTACGILDDYPEVILTRGESWFFETVELCDKITFARLQKHVQNQRLKIVGGWFVQPDCNLASPETYRMHAKIAQAYFDKKFHVKINTGFNVDSFGHSGFLPRFYQDAGIKNYCMMRPAPHEKKLPGEIFRWQSPDHAEILTARIPFAYSTSPRNIEVQLDRVIAAADPAIGHTLCFCGVGDHGGGPAREEIDRIIAYRKAHPEIEICFSHPDAFCDAVRASGAKLPVVVGELQHHASGCPAVLPEIKRSLRLAENRLIQADKALSPANQLKAWKELLFVTFHDVLAGTSIASAYPAMFDKLGAARNLADEAVTQKIRRRNSRIRPLPVQQLIFDNLGKETFDGIFEIEPWVSWQCCWHLRALESIRLLDGKKRVPIQLIQQEAAVMPMPRLAFPLRLAAGKRKIIHLDYQADPNAPAPTALGIPPEIAKRFRIEVFSDDSDTWSHGVNTYPKEPLRAFRMQGKLHPHQAGPLISEAIGNYTDGHGNKVLARFRREANLNGVRIFLRLTFTEAHRVVKMILPPPFPVEKRIDGCPGGFCQRPCDAEEYPIFNVTAISGAGHSFAAVSKDIFSGDVCEDGTIRLTLLRTPCFAHHTPYQVPRQNRYPVTGVGVQEYEIVLLDDPEPDEVRRIVFGQTEPVRFSEITPSLLREKI